MTVSSSAPAAARAPVSYDFRRPMTLAREHGRVLEMAFETFARHAGNQMVARLRTSAAAALIDMTMRSYEDYISSLPAETTVVLFTVEPGRRTALMQFPLEAALVWIDHMLGGQGTPGAVPARELTELEQELIADFLRRVFGDLDYAFAGVTALEAEFKQIQYAPQFLQVCEASTPVIVATFSIRVNDLEGPATVMMNAEGLLGALREGEHVDQRGVEEIAQERQQRALLAAGVERVPVDVALRFRSATVHPREVLGLAVGDLLPLHHPAAQPLDVVVGDRTLAQAAPVSQGSRLAGMVVHVKEH